MSLIVTYQLESEFKKNRQIAIIEGMQELKAPQQIPRIGIFSDAKAPAIIERSRKQTEKRIKDLKARIGRVLKNPALHDPVYKTCQSSFIRKMILPLVAITLRDAESGAWHSDDSYMGAPLERKMTHQLETV